MTTLASQRDHNRIVSALTHAATGEEPLEARLALLVDEEDLSSRFEKGEWGQTEAPITLDATIAGYLPRRLHHAPVTLLAEIVGIPTHQLVGHKTALLPSDDPYSTDVISSSAASLAAGEDAIKLGTFTEYAGLTPEHIAFDALKRLPYNRNQIQIHPVTGVTLNFTGTGESPGFLAHEPVGAVMSRLADNQTIGYRHRDTGSNGCTVSVPAPLGRHHATTPEGNWRSYSSSQFPNWDQQRPHPPTLRFHAVRVYHHGEDGRPLWERIVEVPYPEGASLGGSPRPHAGRTLDISSEDASDAGPDNGHKRASRKALELARETSSGNTLNLPVFDPLLEQDDPIDVAEIYRNDDGLFEVLWAMLVKTYRHLYGIANDQGTPGLGAGSLDTEISYTATILAEDKIAVPTLLVPGQRSSGIHVFLRDPYGVDDEDIYFDQPLTWPSAQGDDLIFHDTAPIAVAGDDLVVSR